MAYIIKNLNGDMLTSGMTRNQVLRGLVSSGLIGMDESFNHPMPRFGRKLVIANPVYSPVPSFTIEHV